MGTERASDDHGSNVPCECRDDEFAKLSAAARDLFEAAELQATAAQLLRERLLASEFSSGVGATQCECQWLESQFINARRRLAVIAVLSASIAVGTLASPWWRADGEIGLQLASLLVVSVSAGVFGSAIAAMQSMLDRHAHGFELESGDLVPRNDKATDRFSRRMAPWFTSRPLLGGFAGLVVFAGRSLFTDVVPDAPVVAQDAAAVTLDDALAMAEHAPLAFAVDEMLFATFLALLAGLFAKTLIERLKSIFEAIIGG